MTPLRPFLLVGLTGGIATGKSTVDAVLRELGAVIIDADVLAREVVEPGEPALAEIAAEFGSGVLGPDGRLDRKALGAIVFADPDRRRKLEAMTHPRMRQRLLRRIDELTAENFRGLVFYDAAVLIESGSHLIMDRLVVVITDEPTQIARLMARDGIGRDEALRKIRSQIPLAEKSELADYVIDNSGARAATETEVRRVHAGLIDEAKTSSRLLEHPGNGRAVAPLGIVYPINMGNRGQHTFPVDCVFARLREARGEARFIGYHTRPSGNFVFISLGAGADRDAEAAVSSITGLDCVVRQFPEAVRLDWHVPSSAITTPRGSVILDEPVGTWRVIGVFLSESLAADKRITGDLAPKVKILGWPSARDVLCAYDRPGEAGDVGQVSRAVVRKLRKIAGQSVLKGSGRAISVVRDIIHGRSIRPETAGLGGNIGLKSLTEVMMRIGPRITVDSAVRFGKPVIEGTRVPVDLVLGQLAGGMAIETVMEEYGLSREDVLAALAYAAKHVAGEDIRATG